MNFAIATALIAAATLGVATGIGADVERPRLFFGSLGLGGLGGGGSGWGSYKRPVDVITVSYPVKSGWGGGGGGGESKS